MVQPAPKLLAEKRNDDWWITGLPELGYPECGPYDTKAEAMDDLRGLVRFFKYGHDREFWTSD